MVEMEMFEAVEDDLEGLTNDIQTPTRFAK